MAALSANQVGLRGNVADKPDYAADFLGGCLLR